MDFVGLAELLISLLVDIDSNQIPFAICLFLFLDDEGRRYLARTAPFGSEIKHVGFWFIRNSLGLLSILDLMKAPANFKNFPEHFNINYDSKFNCNKYRVCGSHLILFLLISLIFICYKNWLTITWLLKELHDSFLLLPVSIADLVQFFAKNFSFQPFSFAFLLLYIQRWDFVDFLPLLMWILVFFLFGYINSGGLFIRPFALIKLSFRQLKRKRLSIEERKWFMFGEKTFAHPD